MRTAIVSAAVVALGLVAADVARAQGMPPMPSPEEIRQRVKEEIDRLPDATAENEHLTVTYKQLPTDPIEFAKRAAGGQIPPGVDPDQIAKQLMPYARPVIQDAAQSLGTLTVTGEVKLKSKKLTEGSYTFGLIMNDMTPIGVLISGGDLKKPLKVPLKRKKNADTFDPMTVEVIADEKSDKKLSIQIGFGQVLGLAGTFKAK